jgi:GNAT superfamily N-acetyltransferase
VTDAVGSCRRCRDEERAEILAIINGAAEAYRGVIPADRWHDPYMPAEALEDEIAAGVRFWGCEDSGSLVGVMGVQRVRDAELIRHAYVLPGLQGHGVGTELLRHLRAISDGPMLVGTWAAAEWAIAFYERNGFELVTPDEKDRLLREYWSIPDRQIETSVVLRSTSASTTA